MSSNVHHYELRRPFLTIANRGGQIVPVNVASGGVACTLNTRYDAMQLPEDILSLAHYPKTVLLIEYFF